MTEDLIVSKFESLGMYTPSNTKTTKELMNACINKPKLDLRRITGIETRCVRTEIEDSLFLAVAAAKDCLKNSKYEAKDLDIIINTSITRFVGDRNLRLDPPISFWMKNELGADNAMYFDLTNACAGMMTGAHILDNMIKAGMVNNGIVVSGECITPIADNAVLEIKEGIDPQFASLTVGDAGAALILDRADERGIGIDIIDLLTFAKYSELCFGMPSAENPGPAMYTDAVAIHAAAISRMPPYLEIIINRDGANWDDYDIAIPHQTSTKAIKLGIQMISKHFNKGPDEIPFTPQCVHKYGNTASTAVIVALYDAIQKGEVKKGDKIVFLTLASGLCLGFISVRIGDLKVRKMETN